MNSVSKIHRYKVPSLSIIVKGQISIMKRAVLLIHSRRRVELPFWRYVFLSVDS